MLAVGEHAISYARMKNLWPRTSTYIEIDIQGFDSQPLSIPLDFVQHSGNNTYAFVQELVSYCVNEPCRLLYKSGGGQVDLSDTPTAAQLKLVPLSTSELTWTKGPHSSTRGRPFEENLAEEDSSSNSGELAEQGTELREAVCVRDGRCIFTNLHSSPYCDVTHVVPQSRPDIYQELLESEFTHEVSMAILLSKTHSAHFNNYDWSLYHKDGNYFIHIFKYTPLHEQHGKASPLSRFRVFEEDRNYPDPILCNWHYKQCVLKNIRGFSDGLTAEDALSAMRKEQGVLDSDEEAKQ